MEEQAPSDFFVSFLKNNLLLVIFSVLGLVSLGIGAVMFLQKDKEQIEFTSESQASQKETPKESKTIFVDVGGGVNKPGLYELKSDARIYDALSKAGGLSQDADQAAISQAINLAQPLQDGTKIYFPRIGESVAGQTSNSGDNSTNPSGQININSASLKELDTLPGIGEVRAQKIIDNRPYTDKKELITKKAITQKIFDDIEGMISLY